MSSSLVELFSTKRALIADGSTGTHLQALADGEGISLVQPQELMNIENPELIRKHHRGYINAGSDILLTNSWAGNIFALRDAGLDIDRDFVRDINRKAAELLASEIVAANRPLICAGSVGPTGWIVDSEELDALSNPTLRELSYKDAFVAFVDQITGLVQGGADMIWIESHISEHEVDAARKACIQVAKDLGQPVPFAISMVFGPNGHTQLDYDIEDFLKDMAALQPAPVAIGFNCGFGPEVALSLIAQYASAQLAALPPLLLKPNCGSPRRDAGKSTYRPKGLSEAETRQYSHFANDLGVRIIGTCCGSFPSHIASIHAALQSHRSESPPTLAAIKSAFSH